MPGVRAYYDMVAETFGEHYQRQHQIAGNPPSAEQTRLHILMQRFIALGGKSVYDVGLGEGTPLLAFARMGLSVAGCDISEHMLEQARKRLADSHVDISRLQWGDIRDSATIANQLALGPFDALVALGVLPHVEHDALVLRNMRLFLTQGSRVFIEFRNKLFSLFTCNRYTKEFILDELLGGVAEDVRQAVAEELDRRLAIDQPPVRCAPNGQAITDDEMLWKFHNPFEVTELLEREGFGNVRFHWYHYHPAFPMLERSLGRRFWDEAERLEREQSPSSWRGYFLCSAFVAEAEVQ